MEKFFYKIKFCYQQKIILGLMLLFFFVEFVFSTETLLIVILKNRIFLLFQKKMNFDDGFTFVKPGKKSRRNVNTKIRNVLESVDIDVNDTIERIQKAKEELHQSEFMRKFLNNLDSLEDIKFIYCFGLGQLRSELKKIISDDFLKIVFF